MSIQKLREAATFLDRQTMVEDNQKILAFARYLIDRLDETRTQVMKAAAQTERKALGPEWPREAEERATHSTQWIDADVPPAMTLLSESDESVTLILKECCSYCTEGEETCGGWLPLLRLKGSLVIACKGCVTARATQRDKTEALKDAVNEDPIINQFMDSDDQPLE